MNVNKYEKMWANVRDAEYNLARTPMNDVIAYLRDHEWVTVQEIGQHIYGADYDKRGFKSSYANKIGAVMRKLMSNGYAEVKKVKKENTAPILITKEDIEKIYLNNTMDMFKLKSEGWVIQLYSTPFDEQIGFAWRKVTIKKIVEPTIKVYRLIEKD